VGPIARNANVKAIEVRDLRKRYPVERSYGELLRRPFHRSHVDALRGVSFEVSSGTVFGILGANGAGKTTLVKILATLVLPTSGVVSVLSRDIHREADAVRDSVGFVVSDERSFYWRLSVRDNLRFFATLDDLARELAERRIGELLERLEITDFIDRPFRDLPTGIRQRVAIARALLRDPSLILMDEPTRSLDPRAGSLLRSWIREKLVDQAGKTILMMTHDALEAESLCDSLAVLRAGRFVSTGTPDEIRGAESGRTTWHLSLRDWHREYAAPLERLGYAVTTDSDHPDGRCELRLTSDGSDLDPALRLLLGAGVAVTTCRHVQRSLATAVKDLLSEETGEEPGR